jgi:hypothetical protein
VYNWNVSPDNIFKFNLKGFIVGNAVTNWDWDGEPSLVKMAYYHNLYSMQFKKELEMNNCTLNYFDADDEDVRPSKVCDDLHKVFFTNFT